MSRQRKRGINRAAGVLMVLLMLTLLISCGAEEAMADFASRL